jgi:ABC-2 type transport system permease protein
MPRLTFAGLLRSEWIKLRTVRATWWTGALFVLAGVGLGTLSALDAARSPVSAAHFADPSWRGYSAMMATQVIGMIGDLFMLVLGVVAVSSEYSSGSIRSTLAAAPRRGGVFAAKAVSLAAFAAVFALSGTVLGVAAAHLVLSPVGMGDIGTAGLQIGLGAVAYLAGSALVGLALGVVCRSAAGGISLGVGIFLGLEMLFAVASSAGVAQRLADFAPRAAGRLLYLPHAVLFPPGMPGSPAEAGFPSTFADGLVVLAAWVAACLGLGLLLFKRRDA